MIIAARTRVVDSGDFTAPTQRHRHMAALSCSVAPASRLWRRLDLVGARSRATGRGTVAVAGTADQHPRPAQPDQRHASSATHPALSVTQIISHLGGSHL